MRPAVWAACTKARRRALRVMRPPLFLRLIRACSSSQSAPALLKITFVVKSIHPVVAVSEATVQWQTVA